MSDKLLKFIFIILFVILLGEVGYFIYISSNQKDTSNENIENTVLSTSENISSDVIHQDFFDYLKTLKRADIDNVEALFSLEDEGIVNNLTKKPDGTISFDLIDENNKKDTDVRFPLSKTVPVSIYKSVNNTLIPATLDQVVEGVKIKFTWTYDLTKPSESNLYKNELIIY